MGPEVALAALRIAAPILVEVIRQIGEGRRSIVIDLDAIDEARDRDLEELVRVAREARE